MKPGRAIACSVGGVLAAPVLVVAACGFPDVTILSSVADGAHDGGSASDALEDVLIAVGEAGTNDPCDLDKDGHRATVCATGAPGDDCDDKDSRVNPGVVDYQSYDDLGRRGGDWNCNGTVEKEFRDGVGECSALLVDCAKEGFIATSVCGVSAVYVRCEVVDGGILDGGASCKRFAENRTQRCR